jgi:decaprenyl-phosphate phosphoribosyltransferase
VLTAVIKALRPKQWIKNLLVLAAPAAAGVLTQNISHLFLGLMGFICASSFGYLINDWVDRPSDAKHPRKKNRPFASQKIGLRHLIGLLALLTVLIVYACLLLPTHFTLVIAAYLAVTLSYSLYLKSLPVTEMVWLALGFLLRAIAGSAIIQKSPTGWFLVAVFFGAIYVVTAKRIAEIRSEHVGSTRSVLRQYSLPFLNVILTVSIAITLLTYALWVFAVHANSAIAQLTIVPFSLSVLLYAYHAETDDAEAPEDLLFKDPVLLLGIAFTVLPLLWVFKQ